MWYAIIRWLVPMLVMLNGMLNIEKYDIEQPLKIGIKVDCKKIFRIYCALIFLTMFYNIFIPAARFII